jgi:hypothetical protein
MDAACHGKHLHDWSWYADTAFDKTSDIVSFLVDIFHLSFSTPHSLG